MKSVSTMNMLYGRNWLRKPLRLGLMLFKAKLAFMMLKIVHSESVGNKKVMLE